MSTKIRDLQLTGVCKDMRRQADYLRQSDAFRVRNAVVVDALDEQVQAFY